MKKGIPISAKKGKKTEDILEISEKEISQRVFPIKQYTADYISFIQNIQDRELNQLVKIILCSGFRFSEALNSFILYDSGTNRYFLTAYALKRTEVTNFKLNQREAVKIKKLREDLILHPERFKTVPFLNLFELDISDIEKYANDMGADKRFYRPISSYFEKKDYWQFYFALKREEYKSQFRVYYLNSKLNGIEKEVNITPSFHFFRKLFASELYYAMKKDPILVTEYMKWSNMNRLLDYIKLYQNPFSFTSFVLGGKV